MKILNKILFISLVVLIGAFSVFLGQKIITAKPHSALNSALAFTPTATPTGGCSSTKCNLCQEAGDCWDAGCEWDNDLQKCFAAAASPAGCPGFNANYTDEGASLLMTTWCYGDLVHSLQHIRKTFDLGTEIRCTSTEKPTFIKTNCSALPAQNKSKEKKLTVLGEKASALVPSNEDCYVSSAPCTTFYPWFITHAETFTTKSNHPQDNKCTMQLALWNKDNQEVQRNSQSSYCGYPNNTQAQAGITTFNDSWPAAKFRHQIDLVGGLFRKVIWEGYSKVWGKRMLLKTFSADKTTIKKGESVTLSWRVINPAVINGILQVYIFIGDATCTPTPDGVVCPFPRRGSYRTNSDSGSIKVYPQSTTNFYLYASGPSGEGLQYVLSDPILIRVTGEGEVTPPTPTPQAGAIRVKTQLDGKNWVGDINYAVNGPQSFQGTQTPTTFDNAQSGTYILSYLSGGPENATFSGISPASSLYLEEGKSIEFTMNMNFETKKTCNIDVKANCDSSPYSGNASYYLNGPVSFSGNYAPYSFKDIPPGLYYLAYVYGGPGLFSGVSPFNPQYCFSGQSLEFTMNFTGCGGGPSPTPTPTPGNNPPTANILCWATKDSDACLGLIDDDIQTPSVILYSHSSDPDNDITSCSWQVFDNNNKLVKEQSNCSPLIWDDELGTYKATLKVTDSKSNSDTAQKNFQIVSVNQLTCDFAWDPDSPNAKQPVDFFDRSLTPSGTTLKSWSWTFEDASPATSTLQSPQDVLFNSAGEKDVTLKVTNSQNNTCTLTKPVKVKTISPKWKEIVPQ